MTNDGIEVNRIPRRNDILNFFVKKKRFDYGKRLLSDFIPFFPAYSISGMRDSPGKVGPVD